MAKFIKSIFNTTERRKSRFEDQEEDKANFTPPLDGRRKLSISRSGRMRQANKKRHSLSLELYNKELESVEIKKNIDNCTANERPNDIKKENLDKRRHSTDIQADEEIDNAFEIIDKS